eukprot:g24029.t1
MRDWQKLKRMLRLKPQLLHNGLAIAGAVEAMLATPPMKLSHFPVLVLFGSMYILGLKRQPLVERLRRSDGEAMEALSQKRFFGLAFRAARPLVPRRGSGGELLADVQPSRLSLPELAEGPMMLDANTLCRSDATCRLLCQLNGANAGPWRALGGRMFHGMELEHEGIFESSEEALHLELEMATPAGSGRKQARVDWKGRYMKFKNEVPTFRDPFRGGQIKSIRTPDDVAYCKCRLRSDLLCADSQRGVYLEVEVVSNPDNLSLAVVDFESGGRSSVTFSPDTGAVIREKKLRESPSTLAGVCRSISDVVCSGNGDTIKAQTIVTQTCPLQKRRLH